MNNQQQDYFSARQQMVDNQLCPVPVRDKRLIALMRQIPRENGLPNGIKTFAYMDDSIPLGRGRFLTEPRAIAKLIEAARIGGTERIMVIGGGTGYLATLLALMGCRVSCLESDSELLKIGKTLTDYWTPNVIWHAGPLSASKMLSSSSDIIFVDGTVTQILDAWSRQLVIKGRIYGFIQYKGRSPSAFVARYQTQDSALRVDFLFDAFVPLIPELQTPTVFSF